MPLPTIIYAGIGFTIFILGLVLYLTSTDFRPEDIFQFLPKMVVSVQKRLDKRRIGALTLIVLGFMATFTFSDRLNAEAANPSGGGASLQPCKDLSIIPCYIPGSSGACTPVNSGLCVLDTNSTLCTTTNSLCPSYSLNFAPKASGSSSLTQALAHNTFYCSSLTSGPLTTTVTHNIIISGTFVLNNLNTTGQFYIVQILIGQNAPSTVFGAGRCGTSPSVVATLGIYAPITSPSDAFSIAFNYAPSKAAGTYYSWIDVDPLVTDPQAALRGDFSSLTMLEVK